MTRETETTRDAARNDTRSGEVKPERLARTTPAEPEARETEGAAVPPRTGSGSGRKAPAVPGDARKRVWVERISPGIDGGRWPAKGIRGDRFQVETDLVADGHDVVSGVLLYRFGTSRRWREVPLEFVENDRYRAGFEPTELGIWQYTVEAWVDEFQTWLRALRKKVAAGQEVEIDLRIGAEIVARAGRGASGRAREELRSVTRTLRARRTAAEAKVDAANAPRLGRLMAAHPDRKRATRHQPALEVQVERPRARFSAWYELFPRSAGRDGAHGTFRDVERLLPYVASMGFDVLYLPPIHPIGTSYRKGRNNALEAREGDPGSPWAIGNREGGHKAVHPGLGTLQDFRRLVSRAGEHGLEVALDIAFQASPDHPYVAEHPEWFKRRPDGTIQYAENPPKKYQDIFPFDFDSGDYRNLWRELRSIFEFWIDQGVRIFRVDNPHTKPLEFWAWCIRGIKDEHPDVLFLAEAFTRPKLMYALAKAGFSQSYTYFTWRNTSREMEEYLRELTETEVRHFFRPNFWPNTPDILPEHLQHGGRAAFVSRLVLAATLSGNYGIYGPAFELMEHVARPGSEEYIDNEKYELRDWNLEDPDSLRPVITRVNRARRDHPALQGNAILRFHPTGNDQLLCFSKHTEDGKSRVLVVVNFDHHNTQSGWVDLDLGSLGMGWHDRYQVQDLLSDARYPWHGPRNYVELDPHVMPAHLFLVREFVGHEQGFDYYA